jgi:hypothetical protein
VFIEQNLQTIDFHRPSITADVEETVQNIQSVGKENLERIRSVFLTQFPALEESSNLALMVTGSDGRCEHVNEIANVEFIVAINADEDSLPPLLQTVKKIKEYITGQKPFFSDLEEKRLNNDLVSSYTCLCPPKGQAKTEKMILTRALDAQFVAGSHRVFQEYKEQFRNEMILAGAEKLVVPKKVKLADFWSDFLRPAIKEIEAELTIAKGDSSTNKKSLGLYAGTLIEDGHYVRGPKYGILRGIQYSVAMAIARKASQIEDFSTIPPTLLEWIDWLKQKDIAVLSSEESADLKKCYQQGLCWYAQLESEVENRKQRDGRNFSYPAALSVDSTVAKQTLEKTNNIVKKLLG